MITINSILEAEKHLNDISAVIFDLDDTLYSEKTYVRSGYQAIAKLFPQPNDIAEQLWSAFERGYAAIDFVLEANNQLTMKDLALHTYRNHIPDISLYTGVKEMMERIHCSKKIGIITDGRPEGQRAKLQILNPIADEIIITDELGGLEFRKPSTVPFIEMQKRLGVPFEKMIYVGDNIRKDFIAPDKLGMGTIYFKNLDGLYFKA